VAAIEIRSLTKRFGATVAVEDLSFEVRSGAITGFLGPNGAGKTTTLRVLLGLVAPTEGSATFSGRRYRELGDPAATVGAVLEGSSFHPGRTGRDHLRVIARAADIDAGRADEVLEMVGLADDGGRRVKGYSLGMRQRLSLAAALLGDPRILVLDEPANGLDPQGIRWLRDLLRWRASEGVTVLVSSHVLAEMAQTVDDVVVIAGGRLVAQGPMSELTSRAGAGVRVRSPQAARLATALRGRGRAVDQAGDDTLLVHGSTSPEVGETAAAEGVVLHELTATGSTLEDVFLQLTGPPPPPGGPA
jgi:ABC-2 type transport system ATP-binding protein